MKLGESEILTYAVGITIAASADRLEEKLEALSFAENQDLIPQIFDAIIDLQLSDGNVTNAISIIKNCLSYLEVHTSHSTDGKAKILREMKHADIVFLDVLHSSNEKEQAKIIQGISPDKLNKVIRALYQAQYHDRAKSAISEPSKTVGDLEREQIMPIISIFNSCEDGIYAYLNDELMIADLFTQYLRLHIVRPELAFRQFFQNDADKRPLRSNARIVARVPTDLVCNAIRDMRDPSDQGSWLSLCDRTVWQDYVDWLVNDHSAESYEMAEKVILAAKNDDLVRFMQTKFNDH